MNIFVLDDDPVLAAKYQYDVHVNKMILETGQLFSTCHRVLDGEQYVELSAGGRRMKRWRLSDGREPLLYKATHVNHPCSIWLRESKENYEWLYAHFCALYEEKVSRTGKGHKTFEVLGTILKTPPLSIPDVPMTQFALAVPDIYKTGSAVDSYRAYYTNDKQHLYGYTNTEVPTLL